MAHKQFSIYKRPTTKKGKFVFYVQFRDPDTGKRLTAMSSGQASRSAAETWAIEKLGKGRFSRKSNIPFSKYAETWWIWDKCSYLQRKAARGAPISRSYCDKNKRNLEEYILPYFKDIKLSRITPAQIEEFLFDLKDHEYKEGLKLAPKTINHVLTTLRVMFREAYRLGYIPSNPASDIGQLAVKPPKRAILNIEEIKTIFDESRMTTIWKDTKHFTISLLAASTGLRLGECQGLQIQHVHKDFVDVCHSWARKYGLKEPKTQSSRIVPIPQKTSRYLEILRQESPFQDDPESFIFYGPSARIPVDHKTITQIFHDALHAIGIPEEERRARNITFHSWRHTFNTLLRTRVPDAKLRSLTGHRTEEMTDHYTHFQIEDYQDVLEIQEGIYGL